MPASSCASKGVFGADWMGRQQHDKPLRLLLRPQLTATSRWSIAGGRPLPRWEELLELPGRIN